MKFGEREAVKVLCDGRSFYGGDHEWSLPTKRDDGTWDAGEWTTPVKPSLCESGYHLTREPAKWWRADNNVRAYLVEYDGETTDYDTSEAKFAVERCRLLRELTREELASLNVFSEGTHIVSDGVAWAYGSATVRAYNSATVSAYNSATVSAYGSVTVSAYGSATVSAYNSATVYASDSATVRACDSATVRACDSATVRACDRSVCTAWSGAELTLTREGESVIIDRRNGGLIINGVDMKVAK